MLATACQRTLENERPPNQCYRFAGSMGLTAAVIEEYGGGLGIGSRRVFSRRIKPTAREALCIPSCAGPIIHTMESTLAAQNVQTFQKLSTISFAFGLPSLGCGCPLFLCSKNIFPRRHVVPLAVALSEAVGFDTWHHPTASF